MTARSSGRAPGRPTDGARRERLAAGRPVGAQLRDRGQATIEYVGIVVVAVALVASLILAVSPVARAIVARIACEIASLGQADCSAAAPGDPDSDAPPEEDDTGWWCETLGWFCPDEPTDDPTSTPTATPTPTGHPTDPANGLPVVDGVTIPKGLDPDSEAVQTLLQTERGREMLQWLADNGIEIRDSSRGSYWDGENVYVDTGNTPLETVRTLVHEANHARSDADGTGPDVNADTRDDYVNGMLDEETRGVVDAIVASRELEDQGVTMPTDISDDTYWNAYDAAVQAGSNEQQARDAAFGAVRDLFINGTFVTSNTGETYEDYYGTAWDDRH